MSNELDDRVHLLKTIADATRLRILGLLADRPHTGRELADALGLSAATVSHHMHRLEGVGIVTATPDATRRVYTLNDGLLSQVRGSSPAAAQEGIDDPDHQRTVRIFFDGPRLRQIPAKRKARVSVLLELLRRFEAGRDYSEPEVNAILPPSGDHDGTRLVPPVERVIFACPAPSRPTMYRSSRPPLPGRPQKQRRLPSGAQAGSSFIERAPVTFRAPLPAASITYIWREPSLSE